MRHKQKSPAAFGNRAVGDFVFQKRFGLFGDADNKGHCFDGSCFILDLYHDVIFGGCGGFDGDGFVGSKVLHDGIGVGAFFLVGYVELIRICAACCRGLDGDAVAESDAVSAQGRCVGKSGCSCLFHRDGKVFVDDFIFAVLDLDADIISRYCSRGHIDCFFGAVGLNG